MTDSEETEAGGDSKASGTGAEAGVTAAAAAAAAAAVVAAAGAGAEVVAAVVAAAAVVAVVNLFSGARLVLYEYLTAVEFGTEKLS
jgi:hypothetical protein